MGTIKNNMVLGAIILFLIAININISVKTAKVLQEKAFTYEDGIVLYNLCKKKGGSKGSLYNRIYEEKNTEFREFLLGK